MSNAILEVYLVEFRYQDCEHDLLEGSFQFDVAHVASSFEKAEEWMQQNSTEWNNDVYSSWWAVYKEQVDVDLMEQDDNELRYYAIDGKTLINEQPYIKKIK